MAFEFLPTSVGRPVAERLAVRYDEGCAVNGQQQIVTRAVAKMKYIGQLGDWRQLGNWTCVCWCREIPPYIAWQPWVVSRKDYTVIRREERLDVNVRRRFAPHFIYANEQIVIHHLRPG